jgi:hypothetical protein
MLFQDPPNLVVDFLSEMKNHCKPKSEWTNPNHQAEYLYKLVHHPFIEEVEAWKAKNGRIYQIFVRWQNGTNQRIFKTTEAANTFLQIGCKDEQILSCLLFFKKYKQSESDLVIATQMCQHLTATQKNELRALLYKWEFYHFNL